ncbi:Nuclease-related domain-containing protein [Blastococcus mobilis]|uniref:Nuclease-related domain-containing protein n=1 Tax=Blastococcus mobilis TaxID=1938746 RepID=A0A239APC5_9ACTN|nr:Nuclease-related domain-containing protein [Blastococcus mobilis]
MAGDPTPTAGLCLDRDLRARRRQLLRTRWRALACALGAFAVSGVLVATLVRHWPFLVGLVVGAYLGAVTVLLLVLLAIADGSLLPRLGRALEDEVGIELHKAPGVSSVVSGVSFAHRDIDHVVLARTGCFAVEVKATFGRRRRLHEVPDLPGKLAQARDGARQIERLLASRGVPLPVTPVLILTSSGTPKMTVAERHDDVLVVALRHGHTWRQQFAGLDPTLDEATAQVAAAALLAYRSQRTDYELARSR